MTTRSANPLGIDDLAARVKELERQNRRLWHAGAGVLLAASTAILMGQAPPKGETHYQAAEKFILNDSAGRPRAVLEVTDEGPALAFYNKAGTLRAVLAAGETGSALTLCDEAGNRRAKLAVAEVGPGLVLYDAAGEQPRAMLAAHEKGPGLVLLDAAGKLRATLDAGWEIQVEAALSLYDAAEKKRIAISVMEPGVAIILDGTAGEEQASIGVMADGRPWLTLMAADGSPLFSKP